DLSALSMAGIAIVIFGLWVLVSGQPINNIFPALGVAATIGVYSVVDAYGARNSNAVAFALSVFVSGAATITIWALLTRRKELKGFLAAGRLSAIRWLSTPSLLRPLAMSQQCVNQVW
ncbi:MAG: hypothetical protein RJB50_945, partial [Actinomycetota bacterium]